MLKGYFVRVLNEGDTKQVRKMDDITGNYVEEWLDSDSSYGLFKGEKLIGYLTLGGADGCSDMIKDHPAYTYDSLLLSDVYVMREYRNKDLGRFMVDEAVKDSGETVFLSFLNDRLQHFYESVGFEYIGDYQMVRVKG